MDSLYFIGKAQFHQLATHISLYHEDMSEGYKLLSTDALVAVGLKPHKFTYWNVPMMSGYLGKTVPLDIHGGYVLIDEEKVMSMATSYGMLRYALLTSAVRAKEGGRWRYDFMTMNVTLAMGAATGFTLLSFGRKRFGWMRRHPIGCVAVSFMTGLLTTVIARQGVRGLGIGIVQAQNSHKKALNRLKCVDCLEDVNTYTLHQIDELREQKLPQQPGMPPPPEEHVQRFKKNVEMQCKLLETDMDEVRIIRKWTAGHLCDIHRHLREDPNGYEEPHGLVLLASDRTKVTERPPLVTESQTSEKKVETKS
ncbi:putative mitochondrial hypothetical protein [Leptomonas pyrrhocoris]|uniref:Transmembrane protein n=1 Tax=Leptomonas pyrrhocoris TaxID=157538 RepID=A0A0M9G3B9_LEPPY|nr:putative mitochondrial hypothetical protein [Leptomonas pyrrhocoris]KPA81309.1 putative mitochondrial hypothetical protein [Leptomonas pyrrhocoris]|eukprot:XP_015659748.1 putative mitochondrial hypothetical protein [Leptomonas pyrrhocoris]